MDLYCEHMAILTPDEVFTPKHHIIFHLIFKMAYQGSPSLYSCWEDEAMNKILKMACRTTSQIQFEHAVLFRMKELLKMRSGR